MKLSLKRVRELVREELLRGIPDFVLRQAASKFVGELRQHMLRYVNQIASDSTPASRADRIQAINQTLVELENEIHELLEEKLMNYLRQV